MAPAHGKDVTQPNILGKGLDEIVRLVTLWQEALGLEDWDISVEITDPRSMSDDWASCGYNHSGKTATISFTSDIASEEDLHSTIVHELFHLIFLVAGDRPRQARMPVA
jgi:predicted metal-dependent hydrolase